MDMLSNYKKQWHILTRALEAFAFPAIEATVNILLSLRQYGLTGDDLLAFYNETGDINAVVNERHHQEYWKEIGQQCPQCSYWMEFVPINIPKSPRNVFGYRGLWLCEYCNNEIFTMEELENGHR